MWYLTLMLLVASFSQDSRHGASTSRQPDRAQILVEFAPESAASETMARSARGGAIPDDAVASYVRSIGRDIGVPLEARRVASGGILVISIPIDELSRTVAQRLSRESSIESAESVAATSPADTDAIQIDFAPRSRDGRTLARASGAGAEVPAGLREKLQRLAGVPVESKLHGPSQIHLRVDIPELVAQVSAKLSKRKDVEHAQPNASFVVRGARIK